MHSDAMLSKELVAASTEPLILALLSRGESYGYAIIQEVRSLSGDQVQWTEGMLYPVLHRMEANGLIEAHWGKSESGRKRKYYSIQKVGRQALARQREQWDLLNSVFAKLKKESYA
jgi:PadR family transcriptional regulator, regulatory protein PadR